MSNTSLISSLTVKKMSTSANVQKLLRLRARGVAPPVAGPAAVAATASSFKSSGASPSSGDSLTGGVITTLFYLSSFLFIVFLILTFINFTIYPIFKLSPYDKGFISMPVIDPVHTAWMKAPPKPGENARVSTPLSTDYTISFDVFVNPGFTSVTRPHFVLYRGDAATTFSANPSFSDNFPNSNLIVYIDPMTNDMKILAMTDHSSKRFATDACTTNDQCYSNSCRNSICAASKTGEPCATDKDCILTNKCSINSTGNAVCVAPIGATTPTISSLAADITANCTPATAAAIAAAATTAGIITPPAATTTPPAPILSYSETVAILTNIPVGSVFRLTIVYMLSHVEVYIDGKLRATKILIGKPIKSLNDFWPPPDSTALVQVGSFNYWSRVLLGSEIHGLLPVAANDFFSKKT
jgi:hypothetical protein